METLTRLVTDSLIRHGFDRPVDPRRLQWSQWFRCDSPHSLLAVPSKPGIFALAEDVMDLADNHVGTATSGKASVGTAALGCPAEQSSAAASNISIAGDADRASDPSAALAAEATGHMLAVLEFSEAHDMAFTLDRMFTRPNPLRARLASGRCFLRFVVLEDHEQRRTISTSLNQWLLSSAEKASGIPAGLSSPVERKTDRVDFDCVDFDCVGRTLLSVSADAATKLVERVNPKADPSHLPLDSGADKNLHCPHPLPSGF
jgi:hypothetical protein